MKALETIVDTTETRFVTLELPPEIDKAYKAEIDRRLEEMEKNPHPGYTMKEVVQRLETRIGRKIKH